ncbi:hypothetical protein SAMN04488038_104257 [Solimonas aquatica]|uniref:Uncharacterized protein n=1 Tax=Solimonas aquatica TaxID=489703 RepID=A0A1H9E2E3_9GAMM|nr:hypothetical protein [Solimonas aquatica]SEQ19861.1 hypothetical protein SAMN04488038_104257 [Solimonas aquatica]
MIPPDIPLKPELAFVVQLQTVDPMHPELLSGRIEHIASGQILRFQSLQELHAFMGRHAAAPARPRGDEV